MQTSSALQRSSSSSSSVQKNPMGIKHNNKIQVLMDQVGAMRTQMQGLMACSNRPAAHQVSYANWQQPSFDASAYKLYVPLPLNPYGVLYYNTGVFNENLPTVQVYSFRPSAIEAPNLQNQRTNRQATHAGNFSEHDLKIH